MRVLKALGRAIDWALDRVWIAVVAVVIGSALTGCSGLNFVSTPRMAAINPRVYNNLQFLYLTTQVGGQREFVYCLYGRIAGDTMFVERLELAEMNLFDGSNTRAKYEDKGCRTPDMLGTGHSHPPGYLCEPSNVDWESFRNTRRNRYLFLTCQGRMLVIFNRSQIPPPPPPYEPPVSGTAHEN